MEGQTIREHLQAQYRQTGMMPAMLAGAPACPDGCELLWNDFIALHTSRVCGMGGPERIRFTDIDAYSRVTGASFQPWQIDAIRLADSAFITVHNENKAGDGDD